MKIHLTHQQIRDLCRAMASQINLTEIKNGIIRNNLINVFGIPRGGVSVAYMLEAMFPTNFITVEDINVANIAVDDLIDSGSTKRKWEEKYPTIPFFTLIDKNGSGNAFKDTWIVFPWERNDTGDEGVEDNIIRLLQFIGEDPSRGGLLQTPERVTKAWKHWTSGYKEDIGKLLKTFEDGADGCDEMVMVKDIPFYTHCEHHMTPFFGTTTVAYIPDGKIVGLSKLSRIVSAFSRRLQVQERLTNQIADAIHQHLQPKGVGVVVSARHLCMESRGIQQQGHQTITSALRGVMRDVPEARAEFLNLAR